MSLESSDKILDQFDKCHLKKKVLMFYETIVKILRFKYFNKYKDV